MRLEFPGHTELMTAGLVRLGDRGFSLSLYGGKVKAFYRNSVLNRSLPLASIGHALAETIVGLISVESLGSVVYFP
jgi:hypothetical protein